MDNPLWIRTKDGPFLGHIPVREGGRALDFCVIGAAKAGTTSLNAYLDQHPGIFMCPEKEPHFFSTDAIFEKGAQWYRGLFKDAAPNQKCGEASTSYTRLPVAPKTAQRLFEANPEMRLIYVIREPVARTESECLQTFKYAKYVVKAGAEFPSKADDILAYLKNEGRDLQTFPVETSEYMRQIDSFLEFFPRENLLVILSEDLKSSPLETLERVFRHIGVDVDFKPDVSTQFNRRDDFVAGMKNAETAAQFKRIKGLKTLKNLVPKALRQRIISTLSNTKETPSLGFSDTQRASLKAHFKPHNERLMAFLERDLSHWNE